MKLDDHNEEVQVVFAIVLAGIISVALRALLFDVPMISDEGAYAYIARFWSSEYELYRDIPFDRPQGLFLLYKMALAFGNDVAGIRLFGAIYNMFALWALGACVYVAFRSAAAVAFSTCIFAFFSTAIHIEGHTVNAELLTLLPLSLSALFTWNQRWFWAGLMAGLATFVKPIGLSGIIFTVLWVFACAPEKRWRSAFIASVAFSLPILASMFHGWYVDWAAYWASFVDRRLLLYSVLGSGGDTQLQKLIDGLRRTAPALLPLLIMVGASVVRMPGKARNFGLLWLASSIVGMAMGGEWHDHYFVQVIPPLAYLCASLPSLFTSSRLSQALAIVLSVVVLALLSLKEFPAWAKSADEIAWGLYRRPAYIVDDEIVAEIKKHTNPGDSIYVAFAEAQLYYLSDRRAAVPQLFFLEVELSQEVFDQVIATIERAEPEVIVVSRAPPRHRMSVEDFDAIVNKNYGAVAKFGPISVLKRRGASRYRPLRTD